MKHIAPIVLILSLCACSAQWHLKQAIKKDPSIRQTVVVKKDTVIVTRERTLVDTLELFKDTVIYQDRVKLKIEYRDNFVNIQTDCPSDTVTITKTIVKTEFKPITMKRWFTDVFILLIVITSLMILLRSVIRSFVIK